VDASCASADGSVNLSVTGGTTPYTYAWTGPGTFTSTDEDLSALAAGTYNVTITDASGCTTTATATIAQAANTLVATTTTVDASCASADGSVNLSVTGGTTPYTYAWTGPGSFTSTDEDLSDLAAGTYNVTVTDASGCTQTASATVG
jgi:predicted short-subunit dehydrogenase-like oxidoreductase (DUF2520 family)